MWTNGQMKKIKQILSTLSFHVVFDFQGVRRHMDQLLQKIEHVDIILKRNQQVNCEISQ